MTPAEKEAAAVNDTFERVVAAYGAYIAARVLTEWQAVNRFTPAGRALMVSQLSILVQGARLTLATLAVRKANLIHALRTGTQLAGGDGGRTLQDLRDAFNESVLSTGVDRAPRARAVNGGVIIPVGSDGDLTGVIDDINNDIEDEITGTISNLGERRLLKIARSGSVSPEEVERSKTMTARGLERIALNGARHTVTEIADRNKKVVGYVRVHNRHASDTPCGFCAVLMSRGPVYRSAQTAGESNQYHAGCHCTVEEVYADSDWRTNPKYALNRQFQQDWNAHFKGQYGTNDEAMSYWRKYIKEHYSSHAATQAEAA